MENKDLQLRQLKPCERVSGSAVTHGINCPCVNTCFKCHRSKKNCICNRKNANNK